jgi:ectoine hydroxylase-related dioxygenase (phytanoyl-CoA dioxygenase family)
MTSQQTEQWEEEGYFVVKGALSDAETKGLLGEVDRLDQESQRLGRDPDTLLDVANIIDTAAEALFSPEQGNTGKRLQWEPNETFMGLIDHVSTLGLVCQVMGAGIQMTWSQALMRPPTSAPAQRWHPDGPKPYYLPRINGEMPLLQLKVGYFLTEMDRPDMGNLCVIPGSHKHGFPKIPRGLEFALKITSFTDFRQVEQIDAGVPGARQLMVEPGDAIGFHNGLFHCVVRNTSKTRRKNLYYTYGPQWQRAGDREQNSSELLARCTPVRRQLLGALAGPNTNGGYHPHDEGAPLVRLFEQRDFMETLAEVDRAYIRQTQE